ncbi:MAG TPA: PqqD family protein [Gemmatimonadales bacterium]
MSDAAVRYQLRSGDVTGKVIDGEAIIMNLATGAYYSMDGVGAALWELLEQGCSREESVSALAERFDVAREMLERDVDAVVDDLLAEELLVVAERPAPAAVPYVSMQAEYATPSLQKFTDMADLLALDPPMPGLDESAWGDATVAG